ncbi:hypothetical protein V6N13_013281 [Hibiscus sabdariffa]|uniref:Uncharacterized protein n=1 Tax=Hibiscus sabdariffa TaxID=183260 RepID=A0ABR2SHS2_9ROSI
MEAELENFIKLWILAIVSLSYCFYFSSKLPKGIFRLISLTPVFFLFLYLSFTVSSTHIVGLTTFFLAWLGNFKLLLFAFDQPPLSPPPPSLFHFISLASLPIKPKTTALSPSPKINLGCHKNVVLAMICVYMYVELELILALVAVPARATVQQTLPSHLFTRFLGSQMEPHGYCVGGGSGGEKGGARENEVALGGFRAVGFGICGGHRFLVAFTAVGEDRCG